MRSSRMNICRVMKVKTQFLTVMDPQRTGGSSLNIMFPKKSAFRQFILESSWKIQSEMMSGYELFIFAPSIALSMLLYLWNSFRFHLGLWSECVFHFEQRRRNGILPFKETQLEQHLVLLLGRSYWSDASLVDRWNFSHSEISYSLLFKRPFTAVKYVP